MDPFNRNPPQTGFNQQYLPPQYMNPSQMMQMQRFPQQNNFQFQNAPYNQAHMLYGNQRFISPNQQAMNTQPPMQQNHQPRPSAAPHKVNPEEEKKQRYKLEQQRKFRDFGSNFGRTTIDTMLNNIVTSSSNQQSKTQTQKFHIEDDFGDFLQANQPNTSDAPVPTPIATTNDDFADFSPVIPPVCISPATSTGIVPVTTQPSSTTENHLQSKMLASLDLNQSKQANHSVPIGSRS
uniref:Uncharacterized protein n=1 Tax=Ciona savignyi TaxID=51511 RepID=H2YYL9_CIOSA